MIVSHHFTTQSKKPPFEMIITQCNSHLEMENLPGCLCFSSQHWFGRLSVGLIYNLILKLNGTLMEEVVTLKFQGGSGKLNFQEEVVN